MCMKFAYINEQNGSRGHTSIYPYAANVIHTCEDNLSMLQYVYIFICGLRREDRSDTRPTKDFFKSAVSSIRQ